MNKLTIFLNCMFPIIIVVIFFFKVDNNLMLDTKKILIQKETPDEKKNIKLDLESESLSIENIILPSIPKIVLEKSKIKKIFLEEQKEIHNLQNIKPIVFKSNNVKPLFEKLKFTENQKNKSKTEIINIKISSLKYVSSQVLKNNNVMKNVLSKNVFENNKVEIDKKKEIENIRLLGKNFLNKSKNFHIEFLWPKDIHTHDKIYQNLINCLGSETVLIDQSNNLYNINGIINEDTLNQNFSNIMRKPSMVYSNLEKDKLEIISNKYLKNKVSTHVRLFNKKIDIYIIGYFVKMARERKININKMSGTYNIINNKLYINNLYINQFSFTDQILLSFLNPECNI